MASSDIEFVVVVDVVVADVVDVVADIHYRDENIADTFSHTVDALDVDHVH